MDELVKVLHMFDEYTKNPATSSAFSYNPNEKN